MLQYFLKALLVLILIMQVKNHYMINVPIVLNASKILKLEKDNA